jgi:hypothetical protein
MALPGIFRTWRAELSREATARRYVATVMAEPSEPVVRVLLAAGDGDEDHARWELRYMRRAMGLLVAERDALDDRTGSDVAVQLELAHRVDPQVAPDRRGIADRQFNDRLAKYRAAFADRSGSAGTSERIARALLAFALAPAVTAPTLVAVCELVAATIAECNLALRNTYGEASLPDDIRPSEI